MKAIEADITVTSDGRAFVNLPLSTTIPPGTHRAVVMVDEGDALVARPPIEMPVHDFGPWPENLSLHRKDLYGDDGR
jgi:hypothetical protein